MMNANIIIANNISNLLKAGGRKQSELADAMNISRQKVSKMLSGERAINAMELKEIASYRHKTMTGESFSSAIR